MLSKVTLDAGGQGNSDDGACLRSEEGQPPMDLVTRKGLQSLLYYLSVHNKTYLVWTGLGIVAIGNTS